ncbi:hypothetical protein Ct9H90mP29_14550 [bacterium]|nr:MAG: hypothetical protein Ct9H90mP29_14550 [bacterium]
MGPNDLANQNFQNYIFVNNVVLGINDHANDIPIQYSLDQNYLTLLILLLRSTLL